jgi:hypothetical protein
MRLTDLLRIDVVDEDGVKLGSLMDLRGRRATPRGRPRKEVPIDTLVFAVPGFLEHVGIHRATSCEAAWKDVVRLERHRIVVRRNAHTRTT